MIVAAKKVAVEGTYTSANTVRPIISNKITRKNHVQTGILPFQKNY